MLIHVLFLALLPQSTVHAVDAAAGPGSQFTTLGAAVSAAADGDALLAVLDDAL